MLLFLHMQNTRSSFRVRCKKNRSKKTLQTGFHVSTSHSIWRITPVRKVLTRLSSLLAAGWRAVPRPGFPGAAQHGLRELPQLHRRDAAPREPRAVRPAPQRRDRVPDHAVRKPLQNRAGDAAQGCWSGRRFRSQSGGKGEGSSVVCRTLWVGQRNSREEKVRGLPLFVGR